jgi:8-oxo-dGTP diphosphatase
MTIIDKIAFIHIKDKKVLVTLSKGKDVWYQPGGKREEGENDKETLIRELKEELNIDIIPSTIVYYGTFKAQAHGKPEGVIVQMTCYTAEFKGKLNPANEIDRYDYFPYSRKKETSAVDHLIFDDLKEKNLIE